MDLTEEDVDVLIRFSSSENTFVYNEGINKGHTLSYSKVNRCLFLSPGAKQLYHNICEYAYDGKRDCYPSQATLCLQLGIGKKTIKEYTDELRDAGLISITQERIGKPYNYHIEELHMVTALVHSEAVYLAIELFKRQRWQVVDAVMEYSKSALYEEAKMRPVTNQSRINEWFAYYFDRKYTERVESGEQEPVFTSRVILEDQRLGAGNKLGIPPSKEDIKQTSSVEEKPVKERKKNIPFSNAPIEDWNAHHFISYFEHLYLAKFKLPSLNSMQERNMMARLIELYVDKKEVLRDKMDIYMAQDFFTPKGVSGFCSSITQGFIDQFMLTGTFQRGKTSSLVPIADSKEDEDEYAKMFRLRAEKAREESR